MSMLDFLVESQFNESFTKEEIAQMSSLELLQKKMCIRNTFMYSLDKEVLEKPVDPIVIANFNKKVVTGEFYPDNYINGKKISNK